MSDVLGSILNLTCYSTGNVDKKQVILICRNLLHTTYIKYPVHVYGESIETNTVYYTYARTSIQYLLMNTRAHTHINTLTIFIAPTESGLC